MKQSKAAIVVSRIIEKIQLILGVFLAGVFGIGVLASIADNELEQSVKIVMYILMSIGILLIIFSRRRNRLIATFRIYISRLMLDPTGSIHKLAEELGTSDKIVLKNLNKMIEKKYFSKAYIDSVNNCIVFPSSNKANSDQQIPIMESKEKNTSLYIPVTCKNCGGINKVQRGQISACEYCGSPVRYK